MRTFNELKGLPVRNHNGVMIGTIENMFVDDMGAIQGFRIDQKGLFHRDCFLPISSAFTLNDQQMIISEHHLEPLSDKTKAFRLVSEQKGYIGKQVISSDGELQGLVDDVFFRPDLGKIEAIEMTEGWFTDLDEGKKVISCHDVQTDDDEFFTLRMQGGSMDEMPELFEQKPWEDRF